MNPSWPSPQRRGVLAALLAAGLSVLAPQALATQPLKKNLTGLIAAADMVVSGTVLRVSDGLEGGVPFTEVTLQVRGALRKSLQSGSEFSFRQWGLLAPRKMPNGKYLLPMQIEGMPSWHAGEQVVVFLNPPASVTGLRSPVGLSQGKFTSVDGRASNGDDNRGLFDGVSVQAALPAEEQGLLSQPGGPVDEGALMGLVGRAIEGRWVETGVMR